MLWAPLSSHSLRFSHGSRSSTKRAPAVSHAGRPAGKSPERTQSENGSVTTGDRSIQPAFRTASTSPSIRGVMRSTDVPTNETWVAIHARKLRRHLGGEGRSPRET